MSDLLKLAVMALAGTHTVQQAGHVGSRMSTAAIYVVGSAIAGAIAAGCLLVALWISVRPYAGANGAYLIVALAAVVLWSALFLLTRRAPAPPSAPVETQNFDAILKEARQLFEQNTSAVLIAALVAGLMAGGSKTEANTER